MNHPLHPALVHFPIACWSLATAADLASLFWGEPAWRFAGVLLAIGTVAGVAAMVAGFVELVKIDSDSPMMRDVNRHMLLTMVAWTCYATSLFLRLEGTRLAKPDAIEFGLSAIGFIALCVAGWLGGKLVYVHGLGARKQPHRITDAS
jgi:uncharacterized membrane protein